MCIRACAYMCGPTALDAHTNFSVMVDRVVSRFARAEEASPDSERERERETDSEKFQVVYHDSQDAPPFSIFIP